MGERRLVLETLCEHGFTASEHMEDDGWTESDCPGGSRRVLSEPSEEMVEAAAYIIRQPLDGRLPWKAGIKAQARAALAAALRITIEDTE